MATMKIDPNEIYDEVRRIVRCEHAFGTQRTEAVGPDGKSRVVRGRCTKCESSFPTSWTETQNLSPYALYLITLTLAPVIDRIVREAVRDVLVGHVMGEDEDAAPTAPPGAPQGPTAGLPSIADVLPPPYEPKPASR